MASVTRWSDLPTPAALVDLDRLEANCAAFRARARELGVRLRPHVKTHKTVEIARLQLGQGDAGLTVSTLAEARHFASAGFRDLTWAVPADPRRLGEVCDLEASGVRLGILVDHPATAAAAARCAAARGVRLRVWLEVDCGGGRSGLSPDDPLVGALAVGIAGTGSLELAGLLTHAGQAYACVGREALRAAARRERDAVVALARRLGDDGVAVPEVSVGSTPTFAAADDLEGVSEARPGNYVFFDAFQAAIGSCDLGRVAFTVAATVIGAYPDRGTIVLNAGALALSRDPGPVHVDPGCGFGVVLDPETGQPAASLRLEALSQEHGVVRVAGPVDRGRLAIGSVVRLVPNHSCLAAACHDRYHVVRGGRVVDEWRPVRGW